MLNNAVYYYLFFKIYFTEVYLIYTVLLASAIQQSDSVIYTYICIYILSFPFFFIMVSYRILNVVPCIHSRCLYILYIIAYICYSQTTNPFLSYFSSPLATTSLVFMSASLFLFHRYIHLCHNFDSTYKW